MTITRQELRWLLNLAQVSRDSSKKSMGFIGQPYSELFALRDENMATLAEKLESILKTDAKCITIK